jgi:hypothetical protein
VYAARSSEGGLPLGDECGAFRKPIDGYTFRDSLYRLRSESLAAHLGSEQGSCEPGIERESQLVVKVCDLYRGLETDISVVLTVMSDLRSSFD